MKTFKTSTRVRYAETDTSGIVYYANYFVYFELGRIEMWRELGLTYDLRLPIVETRCRYHASAQFDDPLEIHTFVERIGTTSFTTGCRVYRVREGEEPLLLVEGSTVMVTVEEVGRPVPLPDRIREALESVA